MRRLGPRPLARALEGVTATLAPATTLAQLQSCWREVVGEGVADESHPVSEHAGVVTLACSSAVWAQELQLMAPELAERVNEALGAERVAELRFRVGRTP
jgi:predicted nucleic acid-binding Zn ribbon protein